MSSRSWPMSGRRGGRQAYWRTQTLSLGVRRFLSRSEDDSAFPPQKLPPLLLGFKGHAGHRAFVDMNFHLRRLPLRLEGLNFGMRIVPPLRLVGRLQPVDDRPLVRYLTGNVANQESNHTPIHILPTLPSGGFRRSIFLAVNRHVREL